VTFEQYAMERLAVLLGTARAICADAALAEDLVQDVLVKVHARWDSIGAVEFRDAYVTRMLVNEFLSWRRKWGRVVPVAELPAASSGDRDFASVQAERDALLAEVRRLPTRQRVVIALRYFADLDDDEIADALGCARSTVRVHASRALATLRIAHTSAPTLTGPGGDAG
jgi:RNA polymerase sigma-70 factor (sigma-E family)